MKPKIRHAKRKNVTKKKPNRNLHTKNLTLQLARFVSYSNNSRTTAATAKVITDLESGRLREVFSLY